jgi:L-gulonolactone oxidase
MSSYRENAEVRSWGGVLRAQHRVASPSWRDELPVLVASGRSSGVRILASGLRRSYGISGLNPAGALIDMTGLDRFIAFDSDKRTVSAEAGISFAALIEFALARGFFLPVTPGTRFVTLGGAIANDIHGKNHHRNGTLGCWIRRLNLLRTDGHEIELTPNDPTGLFAATVGGLGLTGIITRAELELIPIASTVLDVETIPFSNLDAFFDLAAESEANFEYTVAWVDCLATGVDLGRGIFMRGNHADSGLLDVKLGEPRLKVPVALPGFVLNRHAVRAFNALYFRQKSRQQRETAVRLAKFFYPLDSIADWNLIYGRRGMYQYQSVVPRKSQMQATKEMLHSISASGQGSFLAVLKTFGSVPSPGLLSFPCEGTTLALDFPNQGEVTLKLMERLDEIVLKVGGRLYPAKDGRMTARQFHAGYPQASEFSKHVDPGMSSAFWERMKND